MADQSYNTSELAQVRLKLRDDLEFTLQEHGGLTCYVVGDKTNSRYFRIGIAEYTLLSLLDGHATLHQVIAYAAEALGPNAFSQQDAAAICKWLIDSQLATTDDSIAVNRMLDAAHRNQKQARMRWLNPLVMKVPLGSPEKLLDRLEPWTSWIVSRPMIILWLAVSGFATLQLFGRWGEFSQTANSVLARDNWIWLGATWLLLKLIHELSHALTCRRFGGSVRETGLVFVMFVPMPYVDVTSSWRFPSKWQRIAVSAAGMYIELLVAAIAVIVWCNATDPLVRHHAYNTIVLAGITTLLFNANFLMRFDGYYIFADLVEIPNLYSLGQQFLTYLGRRYVLGVKTQLQRWTFKKALVVRVYGVASFIWRILVCVCLVIAAEALLFGFGIVLAFVALVLWLGLPSVRFVKYLIANREEASLARLATAIAITSVGVYLLFTSVLWPFALRAPVVVEYESPTSLRVETAGFVRSIAVQPGQRVVAGQVLVVLENPQVEADRDDLILALRQSESRARGHHRAEQVAAYQAEQRTQEALESRLEQRKRDWEELTLRAPIGGIVVADELDSYLGRFVAQGEILLTIVDESSKRVRLSIPQDDLPYFQSRLHQQVAVQLGTAGEGPLQCRLKKIEPQASTSIVHQALSAVHGGPIPVAPVSVETTESAKAWKTTEPRFSATLQLTPTQSEAVCAGQTGTTRLSPPERTVGVYLISKLRDWLRRQVDRVRS